jgi:hypothetical protein
MSYMIYNRLLDGGLFLHCYSTCFPCRSYCGVVVRSARAAIQNQKTKMEMQATTWIDMDEEKLGWNWIKRTRWLTIVVSIECACWTKDVKLEAVVRMNIVPRRGSCSFTLMMLSFIGNRFGIDGDLFCDSLNGMNRRIVGERMSDVSNLNVSQHPKKVYQRLLL